MHTITVSAIVPCYNVAAYLRDCIESLLKQGDFLQEIICVDDASSDETVSILKEYQTKFPNRILLILNEKNSGASFSRNRALKIAKGNYIQFLDADDFILPNKLKHQLELIRQSAKQVGFIAAGYTRQYEDGSSVQVRIDTDSEWLALMRTRLGCTCSNLWDRETLLHVGGFDENLGSSQEYNLMYRLLHAGAVLLIDTEFFTVARERKSGSISSGNSAAKWKRYCELRKDILNQVKSKKPELIQAATQILFDAIRIWYSFSPDEAFAFFEKEIPKKFQPVVTGTSSSIYVRFYSLFGFKGAERIRKWIGK
jgi:glycosyltransferase involved in cell wall biosynthesis